MNTNGHTRLVPGSEVRLVTPDNPRIDGAKAVVVSLTPYGAHVHTEAAATGKFRALLEEMEPLPPKKEREETGYYTGDCCVICGSMKMIRAGSCACCQECGSTSGCS